MEQIFVDHLNEKILALLRDNPDGLTMSKIADSVGVTIYTLNKELSILEMQNVIQIITVGASKLIKLVNTDEKKNL